MRRFVVPATAVTFITIWLALGVFLHASPAEAATLTVNSTSDTDDGACSALAGANECTFREALNLAGNGDTVRFEIPNTDPNCTVANLCTITPATALPDVDGTGKTINGYFQTGASVNTQDVGSDAVLKIQVDLSSLTAGHGLVVTGDDITIRGLAIYGHPGAALGVFAAIDVDNASDVRIRGNFLGLTASGADGNNGPQTFGIYTDDSTDIEIGSTDKAHRNVTSSLHTGVFVNVGSSEVSIVGNYVGTDPDGIADRGNDSVGVDVRGNNVQVGDASMVTGRNIIAGNNTGVLLGAAGTGADDVQLQGNFIGVKADGSGSLFNNDGVSVSGSGDVLIGGIDAGNIISGNDTGLSVSDVDADVRIEGNRIGTNPAGTASMGNDQGIVIHNSASVSVGGTLAGQGNLISGNGGQGIQVVGSTAGAVVIQGNNIGTNLAGTADLGNFTGVEVEDADDVIIGGPSAAARNIISGHAGYGIRVEAGSIGTEIERNYIGTNQTGLAAIPNVNGILDEGLLTTIALNVISGNSSYGLQIHGQNFLVQANLIGTNAVLGPLPNASHGIILAANAAGFIAPLSTGQPNVIANNGGDGVNFSTVTPTQSVTVSRNSIFNNAGLAIDLGLDGVTPNDTDDPDTGANDIQNWPMLTEAHQGSTVVRGTLDSTPNRQFTLELFSVNACDSSGNGEGSVFRGSATINTNSGGDVTFAVQSSQTAPVGDFITATVTDQTTGNTSEFSNCMQVQASPTPGPTPSGSVTPTPTPIIAETPPPSGTITDAATPVITPTPTATATPTPEPTDVTFGPTTAPPSGSATETPTPTPTPTAGSPTPTPTGAPDLRQGDNDCSGAVDGRDALFGFLFLAQLTGQGFPPCPSVGADQGDFIWADVDCDDDVDLNDAMAILWWLARFEYDHEQPCTEIGSEINA